MKRAEDRGGGCEEGGGGGCEEKLFHNKRYIYVYYIYTPAIHFFTDYILYNHD